MNSELGMLLPFLFVIFVVWNGTRILLVRARARALPPDLDARLADLAARVDQLEKSVDATSREVQRLGEAEQFTTQLLTVGPIKRSYESSAAHPVV